MFSQDCSQAVSSTWPVLENKALLETSSKAPYLQVGHFFRGDCYFWGSTHVGRYKNINITFWELLFSGGGAFILEFYGLHFVPSYPETLGVKPPARDPHNVMASFGSCFTLRPVLYLSKGESTRQILVSLSISCSVHIVKAETALIKSSWRRSAMVSRTWRTLWCRDEE